MERWGRLEATFHKGQVVGKKYDSVALSWGFVYFFSFRRGLATSTLVALRSTCKQRKLSRQPK
jgi:hypothetical protein